MIRLEQQMVRRQRLGNLRALHPPKEALIDFASNDYLGLARSSELVHACLQRWQTSCDRGGIGSTGSRLLTGQSTLAASLEEQIAAFHGYEAGLLFNCGYMANVGLFSALAQENSLILYDQQVHASVHDGIHLGHAPAFPFRHHDLDHLERRLKAASSKGSTIYVCTESISSIDGSMAPLLQIGALCDHYGAALIVDEAHAVGLYGRQGRGLADELGAVPHIFAQVVTFGKALGCFGAAVLGGGALKHYLINFARSFIYTTALPSYHLEAIRCCYERFPKLEKEREQVRKLAHLVGAGTQIQTVLVPGNQAVRQAAAQLAQAGYDVRPLMSPTVPQGKERLRLCLHAFNSEQELADLLQKIERAQWTMDDNGQ